MDEDFENYIYALLHPEYYVPVYVGKGRGERCLKHQKLGVDHYNPGLAELFAEYEELPIVFLSGNLSRDSAFESERCFIALIGRADLGTGPLLNRTSGGEGFGGIVKTEAHKKAISRANTGLVKSDKHRANLAKSHRERYERQEERDKITASWNNLTPEQREKRKSNIAEGAKRGMAASGAAAKISAALSGRTHDEARRKITSDAVRAAYERDPSAWTRAAEKRKGNQPMLGKKHSPEARERMRLSHLARADRERKVRVNLNLDDLVIDFTDI